MNENKDMNNNLNPKIMDLLGTIDKSKIEQVNRMVQNMSKEDLAKIMSMLNNNGKSK